MKEPDPLTIHPDVDITMVVPYYNPGERLRSTVDELVRTLTTAGVTFEVIAVDDGSTDGSGRYLEGADASVIQIQLPCNAGKGEALRTGFARGRGSYIGFIDADGDLPPEQVKTFVQIAQQAGPDMVLGTKRDSRAEVDFSRLRQITSWTWQQLVRALFHVPSHDTQTGLKLFRRNVLATVLPHTQERRFALDLELLVLAQRFGFRQIVEVPVIIRGRLGSTLSSKAALIMAFDLAMIFTRVRISHRYDQAHLARLSLTAAQAPTG
jgi:glycosyltransferase involved in cell wall biosynthesis